MRITSRSASADREGREIEIQERGQPGRSAPAGQKGLFLPFNTGEQNLQHLIQPPSKDINPAEYQYYRDYRHI